jgi:ribosomal-protein-alanine N-acetyltransferase
MIKTSNLQLLICERFHLEAIARHKDELAVLLQVTIPESWPHFPEAFSLPYDAASDSSVPTTDWHGYFFIHPADRVLIGNGGFKGEPDDAGIVEIGYEIASEYWNRGFATQAVRGMIDYAFAHPQIQAVIAHTLAETNASNRVLQKTGMKFLAELADPEEGKIWQYGISRNEYHSTYPVQPVP